MIYVNIILALEESELESLSLNSYSHILMTQDVALDLFLIFGRLQLRVLLQL